jgi:23S rRNA (guanine2445-N2)-methyltransferase / 23S rRNA (guanine2069-N7)-methyltransferase
VVQRFSAADRVNSWRYFAACPKGLEYLLVDELKAMGALHAREGLAGVRFEGDATLGYRACLWSRLASRVLLPVAEFDAADEAALYAGTSAVEWQEHLDPTGTLAVDAHGRTRTLVNTQFAAQRVKDAIVDQCRARHGQRPDVERERPDVRVHLMLKHERATLSIDLSGDALFQRGYRRGQGEAPLKENLAAAMLLRARWPQIYADGGALVDPMCGAGTLLIEGAWMAADVAPGLLREYWGFARWRGYDAAVWQRLRAEAEARAQAGRASLRAALFGSDVNAAVLGAAKANAQAAAIAGFLRLAHHDLARTERPQGFASGLVICNPPYGERMGEVDRLAGTYRALGDMLKRHFVRWRAAVITNSADLGRAIGLRAQRHYQLFNGAMECTLLCFDEIADGDPAPREAKPLSEAAQGLRNRLQKNLKHLATRLKREGITCYRAYDADLPDYAAAIDVYEGHVHVQEYAPPKTIDPERARRRLGEIVRVCMEVFAVPRERIALKTRRPQSRTEQYRRQDERGEWLEVGEGGLRFLVNLHDYLDTGLFLDHRPTRARLRELAHGKRFLNLFCYTGAATVYAAAGGARSTTSVDLSATYLQWAERNLALNGFSGAAHRLVQADVVEWLTHDNGQYDLIFIDPPTFSNSKRAEDFDVQRDHVRVLTLCAQRLAPGGMIVFSNNNRRFKIDHDALGEARLDARDVGKASIPFDFARDARVHQCYDIVQRESSHRG